MSRMTLDLDEALIEAAMMRLSGAKTGAVQLALRELIRHRERELLRRELGSFELTLHPEELRRLRQAG